MTNHDRYHRSRRRAGCTRLARRPRLAGGARAGHRPPDTLNAERNDYGQVVLERRLRVAVAELNPTLPASALCDAYRKLTRLKGATLEARNRAFHRLLVDGVTVEYES